MAPARAVPFPVLPEHALVRMIAIRLSGILVFSFLAGCENDARSSSRSAVRDSAGVSIVENVLDDRTAACAVSEPSLTIGVTDGPPEYQFYRTFGARRLSDGRIAVVNQGTQELRFYDASGVFLS